MSIRVEFYGIARRRVGRAMIEVDCDRNATLTSVLAAVGTEAPQFSQQCLTRGVLISSLAANLDGQQFVSDPATPIRDGQALLILSADAGG